MNEKRTASEQAGNRVTANNRLACPSRHSQTRRNGVCNGTQEQAQEGLFSRFNHSTVF